MPKEPKDPFQIFVNVAAVCTMGFSYSVICVDQKQNYFENPDQKYVQIGEAQTVEVSAVDTSAAHKPPV